MFLRSVPDSLSLPSPWTFGADGMKERVPGLHRGLFYLC